MLLADPISLKPEMFSEHGGGNSTSDGIGATFACADVNRIEYSVNRPGTSLEYLDIEPTNEHTAGSISHDVLSRRNSRDFPGV